jgi:pyridoxamine 5'-phosphate oxidase
VSGSHEIDSEDPLELFDAWLVQAQESEPSDPNAAALATSTTTGVPSVRMVLAKQSGGHRFCFFTNAESRKGVEIAENPRAALCFHWKSLRRQVRVEGDVLELEAKDVNAYFHSRSRASQIGAAVSEQSRMLESREELEERVRKFEKEHPAEIPRPGFWRGFYLRAERIEFWLDGANRLHDRFLFTWDRDQWQKTRLYP